MNKQFVDKAILDETKAVLADLIFDGLAQRKGKPSANLEKASSLLGKLKAMDYRLIDGNKRSEKNPGTFLVPTDEEKKNVTLGDYVKVGFEADGLGGERMWVEVVLSNGQDFIGELRNTPFVFKDILDFGDEISFSDKHILTITKAEDVEFVDN